MTTVCMIALAYIKPDPVLLGPIKLLSHSLPDLQTGLEGFESRVTKPLRA